MSHRLVAPAAVLLALAACTPSASRGPAAAPAPTPAPVPTVAPDTVASGPELEEKELRGASRDLLGTAKYDMPVEANTWVAEELDFLVGQRKAVVGRWLERAVYYQDYVKGVFASYGLPTDMHHLAMVESGYLPTARSRAGAVGMWQFMSSTGRDVGLRIDSLVDERMDPVRSTHAAARHLKSLNQMYAGDWSLAAAAYNAGTGRISRGMQSAGARNFWELAVWGTLAQETKQYVPRLYAVTIIAHDPARFGFPAAVGSAVNTFAYDSVRTDLPTPLTELASMAGVPAQRLADLNPHLYRGTTPPGSYWVWVPRGMGPAVQQAFLGSDFRRDGGYGTYAVRSGDTAEKLALYGGTTLARMRELNPAVNFETLAVGARLRLPGNAARTLAARPVERLARNDEGDDERPAKRSRGTSREGRNANGNGGNGNDSGGDDESDSDRSGREERSERPARSEKASRGERTERPSERSARAEERAAKSEGAASGSRPEKSERESSPPSRKPRDEERASERSPRMIEHVVEEGETVRGLARVYGVDADAIREANDLTGNTLRAGRKLRIPRRAAESQSRSTGSAARTAKADADEERPARKSSSAPTASGTESRRRTAAKDDEERSEPRSPRSSEKTPAARVASGNGRGTEKKESSASEERSASTRKTGTRTEGRGSARYAEHVVKPGDTLWSIARANDTTVEAIREANGMDDEKLSLGQKLRIPR